MSGLQVEGLCKEFRSAAETLRILDKVDLSLSEGEDLSIVGPSGCGKSTFLYILGTLDQPTEGSVELDGIQPFELPEKELAKFRNDKIGFVFQDHHLLPQLSVTDNVLLPELASGTPDKTTVARGIELIERVGLIDRKSHLPGQLSGGERQRVAVARAMLRRPKLLLADEPTGNLDGETSTKIAELLFELPRQENTMLIVVTHSEGVAKQASKQVRIADHQLAAIE